MCDAGRFGKGNRQRIQGSYVVAVIIANKGNHVQNFPSFCFFKEREIYMDNIQVAEI